VSDNPPLDPGASLFFKLEVGSLDYGDFDRCYGLGVQTRVLDYAEGGNNGYVTRLPSGLHYPALWLGRVLTADSSKLITWVQSVETGIKRPTVEITALRPDKTKIASWTLRDAMPSQWTGPVFDPSRAEVAMEWVEIVYHGFTMGA
jgi:phage tail-like protein